MYSLHVTQLESAGSWDNFMKIGHLSNSGSFGDYPTPTPYIHISLSFPLPLGLSYVITIWNKYQLMRGADTDGRTEGGTDRAASNSSQSVECCMKPTPAARIISWFLSNTVTTSLASKLFTVRPEAISQQYTNLGSKMKRILFSIS